MNCPHCQHPESRVTETRATDTYDKRVRICRKCGQNFVTLEQPAYYVSRSTGYVFYSDVPAEPEEADVV